MFKFLAKQKNKKGFTLIELIVVIAIIAVLVAVVAPIALNQIQRSRVSATTSMVRAVQTGIALYEADGGSASDLEEFEDLQDSEKGDNAPYVDKVPKSPFNTLGFSLDDGDFVIEFEEGDPVDPSASDVLKALAGDEEELETTAAAIRINMAKGTVTQADSE